MNCGVCNREMSLWRAHAVACVLLNPSKSFDCWEVGKITACITHPHASLPKAETQILIAVSSQDALQCFILKDKLAHPPLACFFLARLLNSGQVWVNGETNHLWIWNGVVEECAVMRTVAISTSCSWNWRNIETLNGWIRLFNTYETSQGKHERCRHSCYCFSADTLILRHIKSILPRTNNIMKSIHILYWFLCGSNSVEPAVLWLSLVIEDRI